VNAIRLRTDELALSSKFESCKYTIFILCFVICSAVGSHEARGRSVVRFTAWKTETCGARPAAGRKPARDLLTEAADG